MTVTQLKNQLHTIIDKLDDVSLLKSLLSFSQENVEEKKKFKKIIDLGEADIKEGKVQTQEKVEAYFRKKFETRK